MAQLVKIARKSDIPANASKVFKVQDKEIAVFNSGGSFYALNNACPHRGGPLGEGDLENGVVVCPWHGWQFNVTNGEFLINPSVKVPCYPVKTEGDDILLEI